nr:uncharacterized protein LOC112547325 isoform X2 [Pelodiscus sinensis]|eukprot:XP_025045016.1 uncharacterized protein LOC112547325 isoform X2 [Pelodiscus sinensis]
MILLWLLCDLPAPQLFLNPTSAQDGETVLARCAQFRYANITRVFFCKDGVALSNQKFETGQASYTFLLNVSMQSEGRYSCRYQIKDEKNKEVNSALSAPLQLKVTERKAFPDQPEKTPPTGHGLTVELILGIAVGVAVGSCLILAPVAYILLKKFAPKQRSKREPGVSHRTENAGTDDQIQYATIGAFGAARIPRAQEGVTATYAVIGKAPGWPR